MAIEEMVMPKMGESIMEGTVLSWLKQEGDTIEADESVLEVATDKVDTEVPAAHSGILKEILVKEGDVVAVGAPIAKIETDAEASASEAAEQPSTSQSKSTESNGQSKKEEAVDTIPSKTSTSTISNGSKSNGSRFYSPLVMNMAREEGVGMTELEQINGTGREGRVTKKDMLSYLEQRTQASKAAPVAESSAPVALDSSQNKAPQPMPVSVSGQDEIIEMDRMRKMIAQRMVDSKRISPHVTSFVEADVTNIVKWRNRVKQEFKEREGEPITFTPIFMEAVVQAMKDYPMMNIQVDGDRIVKKKAINMGMAVALPSGNLIVPVIHNADQLNLVGLTKKVNELARKARENKLSTDDLQGGTYTISNVGSFGNVMGTPILMQPQVGIMALGAVQKKPAVIETPSGDAIAIRHKMFLSHSYDHRVVDGSLGGMFVRRVADYLERFDLNRPI